MPQSRLNVEDLEEVGRHALAPHPLRRTRAGQAEVRRSATGELLQGPAQFSDIQVVSRRERRVELPLLPLLHDNQPLGALVRQRPEDDPVQDTEDGRVGADPEGQAEQRGDGEDRILQQHSGREANITSDSVHGFSLFPPPRHTDPGVAPDPSGAPVLCKVTPFRAKASPVRGWPDLFNPLSSNELRRVTTAAAQARPVRFRDSSVRIRTAAGLLLL